ncbi:MAG TPA: CDP-alcohol phosphatidyltransferase family protein [Candidatus Acidoferrales bacterium]|nr:CDP-alcohol phosphatidyltransferase family protein [Candidatus Acidoferrales bacterium]
MTPNQITLARVVAAFAAVALFTFFGAYLAADFAAVALTIAAIALDALDGYLARTRGLATSLGAQLDILGDRVVENLFFTLFAVSGLISLWVPVLFFVRGALTDFLRGLAARAGRNGFGGNSMLETWWGRSLVASRASRAAYAALKCVCFCFLGFLLPLGHVSAAWLDAGARHSLAVIGQILVAATVAFCAIRAIPVVWEGRRYLTSTGGSESHAAPATLEASR